MKYPPKKINKIQCHIWTQNDKTKYGKQYRRVYLEPVSYNRKNDIRPVLELETYAGEGPRLFDNIQICDFNGLAADVKIDFREFLDKRDAEYKSKTRVQPLFEVEIKTNDSGWWEFVSKPKLIEE